MKIKNLIDEDFVNYKKPSMFIGAPYCDFKCEKECGKQICQNSDLAAAPSIEIEPMEIVDRFNSNPITEAIVFGGLEPLYAPNRHVHIFHYFSGFISELNEGTDLVVYTGYYPEEIHYSDFQFWGSMTDAIKGHLIFKFGRFIPDRPSRYDDVLGVTLASDNQFAFDYSIPRGANTAREYHRLAIEYGKEIRRKAELI